MKPSPRFKQRFSKAESDYFKSISAGIRKVHDKAVFKPLAGTTPATPCTTIDPQPGGHNA